VTRTTDAAATVVRLAVRLLHREAVVGGASCAARELFGAMAVATENSDNTARLRTQVIAINFFSPKFFHPRKSKRSHRWNGAAHRRVS
jgi:hypothetical protein